MILIEAKWIGEPLEKHDSQLFRYFGTTTAKFGILTNGIIYKFYTDLEEPNKMDEVPFLEINILDLKETQIPELKKFHKSVFDVEEIVNVASELKYSNEFKQFFAAELQNPSDELIKHFLNLKISSISPSSGKIILSLAAPHWPPEMSCWATGSTVSVPIILLLMPSWLNCLPIM